MPHEYFDHAGIRTRVSLGSAASRSRSTHLMFAGGRFWTMTYQSLVYSRECCPGALPTAKSHGLMRRLIVADGC